MAPYHVAEPARHRAPLSGVRPGSDWKRHVGDGRISCDIQDECILVRLPRIGTRLLACR